MVCHIGESIRRTSRPLSFWNTTGETSSFTRTCWFHPTRSKPYEVNELLNSLRKNTPLWNLFTAREAYDPPFTDEFGRFPHYYSQNADILRPVVSELLAGNGLKFEYPHGAPYGLCLTHDVDIARMSFLGMAETAAKAVRGRDLHKLGAALAGMRGLLDKRHDPYWNFSQIMDLEERYNARSSFYFLARRIWDGGWSYDLDDLKAEL